MVAKLRQLSLLTTALFMAFGILSLVPDNLVFALDQTKEAERPAITIPQDNHPSFTYNSWGKPDPFRPFISISTVERPIPTKEPKTPLERYSLNQFKLVGILLADKHFAMVEDPEQISYTIMTGDKIGNSSGTVEEIKENEIIIAEPYLDIYDQQKIRKVSLKLHVDEAQGGETK